MMNREFQELEFAKPFIDHTISFFGVGLTLEQSLRDGILEASKKTKSHQIITIYLNDGKIIFQTINRPKSINDHPRLVIDDSYVGNFRRCVILDFDRKEMHKFPDEDTILFRQLDIK